MKSLVAASALILATSALAGCGGLSPQQRVAQHETAQMVAFSARVQSAISAAQRYNGYLRIFPSSPQTISCEIPVGGPYDPNARPVSGRCTTTISATQNGTLLDFTEQADMGAGEGKTSGGWTVTVGSHGRIISEHLHGYVPQDIS